MRNPLFRRIPREIRGELGKYVVIFLFMVAIISVASGYFIGDASLKAAYDNSFADYNIEDGNLELPLAADDAMTEALEAEDIRIYENFYSDLACKNDSKLRIFKLRDTVNKICLLSGSLPEAEDEIALDRLYMKSNDISEGDTVTAGGLDFRVTGTVALPDYSALYENNTDFMFDTEKFGVSAVSESGFARIPEDGMHWSYSWKYDDPPAERFSEDAVNRSDDLLKAVSRKTPLLNYVPTVRNSAIRFAGNDLGHDRIMMIVMLDMLIVIIAFVFAVTTSNTIAREANVIGTLRASGYTKGELIRHYMAAPLIVLLIASVIGNIGGYTFMKTVMADMYLGSYSLVSYKVLWNADAFVQTTVIPLLILAAINFLMLLSKLSLSPLQFLRRDLKRHQRKKAFKLNTKIPIMTRYRLRVLFQNIPGYVTIFAGLFFASVIMVFCLLFNPLLNKLEEDTKNNMIASHQYLLKMPVETAEESAEKFSADSLKIVRGSFSEDVTIYGILPDSRYCKADVSSGDAAISSAYADKYSLKIGDTVTLHEEFGDKTYSFKVGSIYDYPSTIAVFLSQEAFNEAFDLEPDSFSGYFSDRELTDIDSGMIAAQITLDDLTKTSRQLKRSMGNMMSTFLVLGITVIILVVYMLSKVMIEKNTQSISVAKILGYHSGEISRIYLRTTTIVTVLSMLLCMPLVNIALDKIWRMMMMEYAGWLAPTVPMSAFGKTIALGILTYAVTALILKRKISRVPMDEALKNTE